MHQEQFAQVPELTYSNVCASSCLKTFNTADANSDVGCLYHGDVVCTITDRQSQSLDMPLDQLHDQRLL